MIDKDSALPIYYQLEEYIKQLIATGELQSGDCLPSEREYAEQYGISRMTVRQAISNLVNEGYLYRQRGKGSFVSNKSNERSKGLLGFTEQMISIGAKPSSEVLSFKKVNVTEEVAKKLEITENAEAFEVKRLRLADDVPVTLEIGYFPEALFPELSKNVFQESFYAYAEETLENKIDYCSQIIKTDFVGKKDASKLDMKKNDPILRIERCTYLATGEPIEFVYSIYATSSYKLYTEMKRK